MGEVGNNRVGNSGLKWLTRGEWRNLEVLWLGNNQIEDKGIKYLQKADWTFLYELNLSTSSLTL